MRKLLVALGLVAVIAVTAFAVSVFMPKNPTTETIGGITLISVARGGQPGINEATASQMALNKVASLNDKVFDLRTKTSVFKTGVMKATDSTGNQVLEEDTPRDAWIFEVTGSSKEYAKVSGFVLVDATTGEVMGVSLFQTN